jgi:zinc transport system permease protein
MQSIGFWQSWFIWRDAMLVALLAAAGLAYLGVWVVLKRVVYVPLALAQVSSVGVVATYFFTSVLGVHPHNAYGCAILLDPSWLSLLVALGTAFWFARPHDDSSQATVAAYLLSGAAVLILGGFVQQDLHDLQTVLFGNAVLVETKQIIHVGAAVGAMLIVHALLYRRILFVSFDPNAAGAAGVGVFSTEVILYASFALVISVATRAIGALPAFGLMVLG